MNASPNFVDPHTTILHREADLSIDGQTITVEFGLSEAGELSMEALNRPSTPPSDGVYDEVEGQTRRGEKVIARNLLSQTEGFATFLSPQTIELIGNPNRTIKGEKVTVTADLLGYQYKHHAHQFKPYESLELLTKTGMRAGGGNTADWTMVLEPLPNYDTRVETMQNYHNLVRTVEVATEIEGIYGGVERIAEFAADRLQEVCWLSSYIQGTLPAAAKLEISSPNTTGSGSSNPDYVQLNSVHSNIGSSGQWSQLLFRVRQEIATYLERAYDRFRAKEEPLQLRSALGLYIDSLNSRRPIEPRFVNLCLAIEMLANRFSPHQGSTEDQIRKLVQGLDVEFMDLISVSGSFPTEYHPDLHRSYHGHVMEHPWLQTSNVWRRHGQLPDLQEKTLEYFWYRSRNHVVHGGSNLSQRELMEDFDSVAVLFKRILRELLLEGELAGLHGLRRLERRGLAMY